MNCVIPGQNLKVMGKAIHALAKIGDELYLEANEDDLVISTVSTNRTAYAVVKFMSSFFTHYETETADTNDLKNQEGLKCKMPMQAILGVFKSPKQMEKHVEICKVELNRDPTKILFKFRYKHVVNKIHSLWLLDGESLQVSFNDSMPNQITAPSSLYTQVLANFQLSDEEVSLDVSLDKLVIRNYIEGETTKSSHVRSQLTLDPSEFDCYKINNNVCIAFSLKPFKAAIQLAEYFNLNISMNFHSSGKPLMMVLSKVTFEANFILATINNDSDTQSTVNTKSLMSKAKENKEKPVSATGEKSAPGINNWDREMDENSEQFEEIVIPDSPESPRRKKLKTVFKRCFESTYHQSQLEPDEVILAANSDPEFDF